LGFSFFLLVNSQTLPNDDSVHCGSLNHCSGAHHGTCTKKNATTYDCVCESLYEGDDCSIEWKDKYPTWYKVFIAYSVYEIVLMLIVLFTSGYQLAITIFLSKSGGWNRWTVSTYINLLVDLGAVLRIIDFAVDPHDIRGYLTPVGDDLLFNIPLILWLMCGFMLFLYWIELQLLSGIKELTSLSKLKPLLITFTVIIAIVLIPIVIGKSVTGGVLIGDVYNAFFIICFVILIVLSSIAGVRLMRIMSVVYKSTRLSHFKLFLQKITRYLFLFNFFLFCSIATLVIFILLNAGDNHWLYLGLHIVLRLEEFSIIMCTLVFLSKKKPSQSDSSNKSGSRVEDSSESLDEVFEENNSSVDIPLE